MKFYIFEHLATPKDFKMIKNLKEEVIIIICNKQPQFEKLFKDSHRFQLLPSVDHITSIINSQQFPEIYCNQTTGLHLIDHCSCCIRIITPTFYYSDFDDDIFVD